MQSPAIDISRDFDTRDTEPSDIHTITTLPAPSMPPSGSCASIVREQIWYLSEELTERQLSMIAEFMRALTD